MAGSYNHAVTDRGHLRNWKTMLEMVETRGDVYETIEEMYGMIWYLADGDPDLVEQARLHFRDGLAISPGQEPSY